jgi:hypothetical protein
LKEKYLMVKSGKPEPKIARYFKTKRIAFVKKTCSQSSERHRLTGRSVMKLDHRGFLKTAGLSAASLIRLGGLSKVASTRSKTCARIGKMGTRSKV